MRARWFITFLIGLMILPSAGCNLNWQRYHGRNLTIVSTPDTITRSWGLVVDESTAPPRIKVNMKLTEGMLRWTLTDPAGEVRWEHRISGRRTYRKTLEFEPLSGVWLFQFDCVGAGDFVVEWMGFKLHRE